MKVIFYDMNGKEVDWCEPWQKDMLLPHLLVLYGSVTYELSEGTAAPALDFWEWMETI